MAAHAKRIEIAVEDRAVLERWANARATERRLVDRARIVLLAAEGQPASRIAERVRCSLPTVTTWRSRYQRDGLDGLSDRPKTGRPLTHGSEVRAKLIALACTRPPDTAEGVRRERWTHAELAEQVGMSQSQAHAILRGADIRRCAGTRCRVGRACLRSGGRPGGRARARRSRSSRNRWDFLAFLEQKPSHALTASPAQALALPPGVDLSAMAKGPD